MNDIQHITEVLEKEGDYRPASHILKVGGLEFPIEFSAVMEGPGERDNIVLLLDVRSIDPDVALRRLRTLARILDRTGSGRTLTLVVLTDDDDLPAIKEMRTLSRLIIAPTLGDARDALGGLLPLRLPEPFKRMDSASNALKSELGDAFRDPVVEQILKAAREGSEQVRRVVQKAVETSAKSAVKSVAEQEARHAVQRHSVERNGQD